MDNPDYSFVDKLLHHLALGIPAIARISFELDGPASGIRQSAHDQKHVFVSGLARAGTTILLRTLYDTGQFCSLTYRDMPFVLMPCTWKRLSRPFSKNMPGKERAHGDGLLVDYDSPEAFEEVFWRVFCAKDYITGKHLHPHTASDETINDFRIYIQHIINCAYNRGPQRYLSKNNNNILRLDSIRRAFPESLIIVPFREPLQHAYSLLNQNQKFCERHAREAFSRKYMHWLGHHEFGLTHKAFQFSDHETAPLDNHSRDNINYWLSLWINTYSYILGTATAGCRYVCFESLCAAPETTLRKLFAAADLQLDEGKLKNTINPPYTYNTKGASETLVSRAQHIYQQLQSLTVDSPARTNR